jgi:hypothetical protein
MSPSEFLSPQHIGYNYLTFVQFVDSGSCTTSDPPAQDCRAVKHDSSDEDRIPYYFATKSNTPVEAFDRFIQELDGGMGISERTRYRQIYRTRVTKAQAEGLRKRYPFLMLCYADVCNLDENGADSED